MDQIARDAEITLPFRIMPSRRRNDLPASIALLLGTGLVVTGGVLTIAGMVAGDRNFVREVCLIAASVVPFGLGYFMHQRERRYFAPNATYWMTIAPQSLTIATPDGDEIYDWNDLDPFVVTRVEHKNSVSYTLTTGDIDAPPLDRSEGGGRKLEIELRDFATQLADDERRRTETMCKVLNDLRQLCLSHETQSGPRAYQAPPGLVVAPMPAPESAPKPSRLAALRKQKKRPKPARPISSVIER